MKNKIALGLLSCLMSNIAISGTNFMPSGSNLSSNSGNISQDSVVMADNPALTALALKKANRSEIFRTNMWSSGGYFEFGAVENLFENIKSISDNLQKTNQTLADVQALQNSTNQLLKDIGDDGYFQVAGFVHFPSFPITINAFGGAIVYDLNMTFIGYTRLLDSDIEVSPLTNNLTTSSSMYIKSVNTKEFSIDYSRHIMNAFSGAFYAGVKAKLINMQLAKDVIRLDSLSGSNVGETIENKFTSTKFNTTSGFGFDIGAVYATDTFHIGATVININSPSFAYGTLGGDCSTLTGTTKTNCDTANILSGEINLSEVHKLNAQAKINGGFDTSRNGWRILASIDLNATHDPVANLIQNINISASSLGDRFLIPAFRTSLTTNIQGNQLTWLSLGATYWDFIQMDVAFPLKTVQVDGTSLPVGFKSTFGVEISF
jgi:hypothetical protein